MGTPLGLPWENRFRFGESSWSTYWRTAWDVLVRPGQSFLLMKTYGGVLEPLVFVLPAITFFAVCLASALGFVLNSPGAEKIQFFTTINPAGLGPLEFSLLVFCALFSLTLIAMIATVVFAHGVITFFGADREGFEGTFRVISYVTGSFLVFSTLCLPAFPLVLVLACISIAIGLRDVHGTSMTLGVWSLVLGLAIHIFVWGSIYYLAGKLPSMYKSLYDPGKAPPAAITAGWNPS